MKLQNAVCIVTGSGTGIGAACALELARRGCRTVINYSKNQDADYEKRVSGRAATDRARTD